MMMVKMTTTLYFISTSALEYRRRLQSSSPKALIRFGKAGNVAAGFLTKIVNTSKETKRETKESPVQSSNLDCFILYGWVP